MLCPYCSDNTSKVIDSRDSGGGIRRRRECLACSRRYSTMERSQTRSLMVVKQDGRREDFSREKLLASLTKPCAKRPLPIGAVSKIADEIESALVDSGKAEIPSHTVGELAMDRLKDIDRVAYIRYASVYRDFKDIETFKEEVEALLEPSTPPTEPSPQLSFLDDEPPFIPVRRRRGRPRRRQLLN